MPLLTVIIVLIAVGVLLWLFNKYVTIIDATIKKIIIWVVVIGVIIWLLTITGLLNPLKKIQTPHVAIIQIEAVA